MIDSPLRDGFGAEKVKIFRIEAARDGLACEFGTEDDFAPEPVLTVRCSAKRDR